MKKLCSLFIVLMFAFSTVACTQNEKTVAKWGAGGAALGALGGAAFGHGGKAVAAGAAIGAVAGGLIGYSRTKNHVRYCHYRDNNGKVYEARCK